MKAPGAFISNPLKTNHYFKKIKKHRAPLLHETVITTFIAPAQGAIFSVGIRSPSPVYPSPQQPRKILRGCCSFYQAISPLVIHSCALAVIDS